MSGSATFDTVGGAFDSVGARKENGISDDASHLSAQEAYSSPEDPQAKQTAINAFNADLQENGIIPGLEITDMGTNPEHQTVNISGVAGIDQGSSAEASYDPTTHNLTYARNGVSGNTDGLETVSVNMVTGRETVSYINSENALVTETRDAVGEQYPTSTTEYRPPAGSTNFAIDPATGKPSFDLNGTRVAVAPTADNTTLSVNGRDYKVDRNNNVSYKVNEGDNLWTIASDVTALNGGDPNDDVAVRQTVDQLAHTGKDGNEDLIIAGDTLTFGANSGHPEDAINMQDFNAHPEDGTRPQPVDISSDGRTWFPSGATTGVPLPDDVASTPVIENDNLVYTNSSGNTVTVTPSGQETTQMNNFGMTTTVLRENVGAEPSEITVTQSGQPEIKLKRDGDSNTFVVSLNGEEKDQLNDISLSIGEHGQVRYRMRAHDYAIENGNYYAELPS